MRLLALRFVKQRGSLRQLILQLADPLFQRILLQADGLHLLHHALYEIIRRRRRGCWRCRLTDSPRGPHIITLRHRRATIKVLGISVGAIKHGDARGPACRNLKRRARPFRRDILLVECAFLAAARCPAR